MSDLREFIEQMQARGDLRVIEGADWDLEIGTMAEVNFERNGPALVFDRIKDYPAGYRVASNLFSTGARSLAAMGFSPDLSPEETREQLGRKLADYRPVPPTEVSDGPILENSFYGDDVDLWKFPTPRWHEADGGRYLGTGCIVIMRDPDTGEVNLGTYRVMVHDKNTLGLQIAGFHQGSLIERKYWAKGQSCPVAIAFGEDPVLFMASSGNIQVGYRNEYELVGYFEGKPVEVIPEEVTGLPIPAGAEIVIAGAIPPRTEETRMEGPFGEFTGYYTRAEQEQVVHVQALYHRDNPIILGMPPMKHRGAVSPHFNLPGHANEDLLRLQRAGIEDVVDVWRAALPGVVVVQIRQRYSGHAMKAGLALTGEYNNRFVIVVDEDVQPNDPWDLLWAIGTRCDPETAINVIKGCKGHRLDPRIPPEKKDKGDLTCSCVIINACKPYDWLDRFPKTNIASQELKRQVAEKWVGVI